MKRVVLASATWRPDSISLHSRFAPATRQEVIAEITEADGDGSHGFARRKRTGVFRRVRMPVVDRFESALQVGRPAAYLLPPALAGLVTLLRAQGIGVSRLTAEWAGAGEGFLVDSIQVAPFLFEGHRTVSVAGHWVSQSVTAKAGWYYVTTDQRSGVLAAGLLEPASEDGFATWNLLDRDLRAGEQAPILRLPRPITAPLVQLE